MIDATIVQSIREQTRVFSVCSHHPNRRHTARGCSTKGDRSAVSRFTRSKVPDGRSGMREERDRVIAWIETADFSAAARKLRLVIAIEMVDVGPLRLKLPGNLRSGQTPRKQDRII